MTARLLLVAALMAFGCDEPEVTEAPGPPPGSETETEPEPELPAPHPDEACARVIVVAWQGALAAGDDITRSEADARARADALRARIEGGATFADVARAESDASATGPRGGLMGTYTREDWPPVHAPIQDAIFALRDGELSEPIRAPYGWVIAERCEVEKVHTRHILVRFQGARNADDVTRSRDEARALATDLRAQATADDADFAALAREHSEDGSAQSGGDVGELGRGRLAPAYEEAAFALRPGEVSDVVETEFGFHVIQRMPDE